jgi:acetoacetyl-[acyl-carrier protein] synthase
MSRLPIITAMGGINAAGRSSGHHAYRRLVYSALSAPEREQTLASLAALTGDLRKSGQQWLDGDDNPVERQSYLQAIATQLENSSLIRKLEATLFDPEHLQSFNRVNLGAPDGEALEFEIRRRDLPSPLPAGWTIVTEHPKPDNTVWVRVQEKMQVILPSQHASSVNSAGQLPTGFNPASLYQARNHPRALQMMVYAASDAINSMGLDWQQIRDLLPADQISVYAGSGLGQLDGNGFGGMLQARLLGRKVTSKQLPLGYAEMPADFINAYLLGNLGTTGTNVAACATFLYNLRQGIRDIQTGSHRLVIVGTSEAPLVPEIFEGFANMGALADDAGLRGLDGLGSEDQPDYRRACRPFGHNCGFTLAESAQCIVLCDDELALELGCNILGSVNDVFINADGHKKSIASPGLGNYLSMAKAAAVTAKVIGEKGLAERSFVQAHGTGTPQNRLTESHILSAVADNFGISNWPVSAVKAYLGHSLASSAGDQLVASLGVWQDGWIPGIATVDSLADDVSTEGLEFLLNHKEVGTDAMDAVLINSKGFGGNNASASILSPQVTLRMLGKRHGQAAVKSYLTRNEKVAEQSRDYDAAASAGQNDTIYKFDHEVLDFADMDMRLDSIGIRNYGARVSLDVANPYPDMTDPD